MKLSPYMNINRIEFMVTYNCIGKCIHCSVADKLNSLKEHNHVREKGITVDCEKCYSVCDLCGRINK